MELSTAIELWCAVTGTLQAIGTVYGFIDRTEKKKLEGDGNMTLSKFSPLAVSILLGIGTLLTVGFGIWVLKAKPFDPVVKTVTVEKIVEKPIPCPPTEQKQDHGSTRGNNSPITNGNDNKYDFGARRNRKCDRMKIFVGFILFATGIAVSQTNTANNNKTNGPCSPIVIGSNNVFHFEYCGSDSEQ